MWRQGPYLDEWKYQTPNWKKKAIFQIRKESNTVDHDILSNITLEISNAISFSKTKHHEIFELNLMIPK